MGKEVSLISFVNKWKNGIKRKITE